MRMTMETLRQAGRAVISALDPLSKLAQIAAVVIAGIWTYHIQQITGAEDLNPEVWVSTQAFDYSKDTRLLVVRIREKNVGKVPLSLKPNALTLVVKKVPDSRALGHVDMDRQPALFDLKGLFKRYGEEGVYLGPGAEFEDVTQFVIAPGTYHVEATLLLEDGDTVNDIAFQRVD